MMKRILPLACMLVSCSVFSQTDFRHGYLIDRNGKKIKGSIEWEIQDGLGIYFKPGNAHNGTVNHYDLIDIERVCFDNGSTYAIIPWGDTYHVLERDVAGPYIELWHDVKRLDYELYLSKPGKEPFCQVNTFIADTLHPDVFSIVSIRNKEGQEVYWYYIKTEIEHDLERCHTLIPSIDKLMKAASKSAYDLGVLCDTLNASSVRNQTDGGVLLSHFSIGLGVGKIMPCFYMKGYDPDFGRLQFTHTPAGYFSLDLLYKDPYNDRNWTGGFSFYYFQSQINAHSFSSTGSIPGSRTWHTDFTQMGFGPILSFLSSSDRKVAYHLWLSGYIDLLKCANENISLPNGNTAPKLSRDFGLAGQTFSVRFSYGVRLNLPHNRAIELSSFATYMDNLTFTENYLVSEYSYGATLHYYFNR